MILEVHKQLHQYSVGKQKSSQTRFNHLQKLKIVMKNHQNWPPKMGKILRTPSMNFVYYMY